MQVFVTINKYWNEDKCRCDRNKLIDKGICDKGFIWNPSSCECEFHKSVGVYRVFWRERRRAFLNFEPLKYRINTTKITILQKTPFFKVSKK